MEPPQPSCVCRKVAAWHFVAPVQLTRTSRSTESGAVACFDVRKGGGKALFTLA